MTTLRIFLALVVLVPVAYPTTLAPFKDGGLLVPTDDSPWPMYGRDAGRSANAGSAAVALDVPRLATLWDVDSEDIGNRSVSRVSAADIDGDGDPEIIVGTGLAGVPGQVAGGVAIVGGNGDVRWTVDLELAPTSPLVADFDADGEREVFVSVGRRHVVLDGDGLVKWTTITPQTTGATVSFPLAVDVTGDGALDILQTTFPGLDLTPALVDELPGTPLDRPQLVGFDGRTGMLLGSHSLACGQDTTQILGVSYGGLVRVIVGCFYWQPDGSGRRGAMVEAFHATAPLGHVFPGGEGREQHSGWGLVAKAWETEIRGGTVTLHQVVMADVVRGGPPEVLAIWQDGGRLGVSVLDLDGSLLYEWEPPREFPASGATAVGDVTGDGADDLILLVPGEALILFESVPGGFIEKWSVSGERPGGVRFDPSAFALADLDADGNLEIITSWQGAEGPVAGMYVILDRDGLPLWERIYDEDPPVGDRVIPIGLLAADVDGNGGVDILGAAHGHLLAFGAPVQGEGS